MTPSERRDFFQNKYEYYRVFSLWVIIFSCLASVTYFVSDCQIFGRFAYETLIPRCMALIEIMLYVVLYRKYRSYKVMVPATYFILHCIMWNTIWAIVYLPNKDFAREGFIIMHIMFFAIGFCAPIHYAIISHSLLIVDILVSYTFNHYEHLDMMLSLGIPCVFAICCAHVMMQKLYNNHYQTAKELERLSSYDALTGAYNRTYFATLLEDDSLHFQREIGKNLNIIMFDIDFFKKVNDTYGHMAGDEILKSIVQAAIPKLTMKHYFFRWGGEEFVILLPDSTVDQAKELAENLRKTIEDLPSNICSVTISLGVATYDGIDYKDALSKADQALYMAKESGRNCVKVFTSSEK